MVLEVTVESVVAMISQSSEFTVIKASRNSCAKPGTGAP